MNIDAIEIISGKPDFEFKPLRRIEVKCEATNALMPAPTIEEANGRLRALAAKAGGNAVIEVEYNSGISFTSWKSLKATGLAVERLSDERPCPFCAESIKRAAVKCRFCGESLEAAESVTGAQSSPDSDAVTLAAAQPSAQIDAEPLRDNNNPALVIGMVVIGLVILSAIIAAAG